MKNRIALWGKNDHGDKLLLALELMPESARVRVFIFNEASVGEEFHQAITRDWRDGKEVDFPEGHTQDERDLSVSGNLLPDGISADKPEILSRIQAEWNFSILSGRLFTAYQSELIELKDKIGQSLRFDKARWDELKGFWDRVQTQAREKSLFRDHTEQLKTQANALFEQLKEMRGKLDEEFERNSRTVFEELKLKLEDIERKVSEGVRLQPLFDELKEMQKKIRDLKLSREDRNRIWDKLDATFKALKAKRFGPENPEGDNPLIRIQKRYDGLVAAIRKMEGSVARDEEELRFQNGRVDASSGQLEAQIRQAKVVLIEERIRSKKDKLVEMVATKMDLERRMEQLRTKDKKKEENQRREEARKAAQDKIAEDIANASAAREKDPQTRESLLGAAAAILGDSLIEVVDTVKAVASVVEEKVEEKLEEIREIWETDEPNVAKESEASAPAEAETRETGDFSEAKGASGNADGRSQPDAGNQSEEKGVPSG